MADFDSAFTIEELTGDQRSIRLVGSGQPFRPATWEVQQIVSTTWYPGNGAEACQHVLGPQDPPMDYEGMWRRTLLGRTPVLLTEQGAETQVVFPMDLYALFDDICRRGHKVRVTWAALDGTGADRGKIVREGRLQKFTASPDRVDDVGWKMHFEWSGRGQAMQRVAVSREGDIIASISKAKSAANALASMRIASQAISSIANIPGSVNKLTLGQLEQLMKVPDQMFQAVSREAQRLVSTFDRIGGLVNRARALPFSIANSALATAHDAISVANRFQDQMGRISPEQMSTQTSAADVLRAANHFSRGTDSARQCAESAHELQMKARSLGSSGTATGITADKPAMLGIHVVHAGETVSSIAKKWYNNADATDPICRSNKLPLNTVVPGKPTLVIPAQR
jgi:hypothetical protein